MERLRDYSAGSGTRYLKYIAAKALAAREQTDARQVARTLNAGLEVERILDAEAGGFSAQAEFIEQKTAIGAGVNGPSSVWASDLVTYTQIASEFAAVMRPMTLIGRMPAIRRVPFNTRYAVASSGPTMGWTTAGGAAPVGKLSLAAQSLGLSKYSGIVVLAAELARISTPSAVDVVRRELSAAAVQGLDQNFIDPGVIAVADTNPASITNGASSITQSGGSTASLIAADLATMVAVLADANAMQAPVWIMRNADAARLACKRDTAGGLAFPDIKPNGGTLVGIPVLTTNSLPYSVSAGSVVVLVDAAEVVVADEGPMFVDVSGHASIEMDTVPTNNAVIPTATQVVSMFQTGCVAVRLTAFANWKLRRSGAIATLDNVHW